RVSVLAGGLGGTLWRSGNDFIAQLGVGRQNAMENAAQIPTSFGGAVCMIFSVGFVAVTVMIEAWPMYLVAMRSLGSGIAQVSELTAMAPALVAVLVSTAIAVIVPLRLGLKSLERLRD
ncbi:MAG: hypothetical protein ND866_10215, partial [Pyrinomonadaceae bacterium]|nr:hypothetical protein [Pyrinomonadaceae bacterium]